MTDHDLGPGASVSLQMGDHLINYLAERPSTPPFPFTGVPILAVALAQQLQNSSFVRENNGPNPVILMVCSGIVTGVAAIVPNVHQGSDRVMLDLNSWVRVDATSTLQAPVLWLGAEGVDERQLTQVFPGVWATKPEYYELMGEWTSDYVIIRS